MRSLTSCVRGSKIGDFRHHERASLFRTTLRDISAPHRTAPSEPSSDEPRLTPFAETPAARGYWPAQTTMVNAGRQPASSEATLAVLAVSPLAPRGRRPRTARVTATGRPLSVHPDEWSASPDGSQWSGCTERKGHTLPSRLRVSASVSLRPAMLIHRRTNRVRRAFVHSAHEDLVRFVAARGRSRARRTLGASPSAFRRDERTERTKERLARRASLSPWNTTRRCSST